MARVCLYYGHRGARLVALLGGGRNAGMHLEGHVRLQNQLKALSKPMQKQALEYAVLQGANIIKNELCELLLKEGVKNFTEIIGNKSK